MPIVNGRNGTPRTGSRPVYGASIDGGPGESTVTVHGDAGAGDNTPNWFNVGDTDTWKSIARQTGLTVQQLKNRNRWLAGSDQASLRGLRGDGRVRLTVRPERAAERERFKVTDEGTTWMDLARRFNIPVEKLLELNGITVGPNGKYKRRIDAGTRVQLRPSEGGGGVRNSLDPWQRIEFQMQRMQAQDTYDNAMSDLAFAREMGGVHHQRSLADLTNTYDDTRRGITPGMARRGLFDSGLRVQAIQDMADAFNEQRGNLEFDWTQQQIQWDDMEAAYADQLDAAKAAIKAARQAARTQASAGNIGTGA